MAGTVAIIRQRRAGGRNPVDGDDGVGIMVKLYAGLSPADLDAIADLERRVVAARRRA